MQALSSKEEPTWRGGEELRRAMAALAGPSEDGSEVLPLTLRIGLKDSILFSQAAPYCNTVTRGLRTGDTIQDASGRSGSGSVPLPVKLGDNAEAGTRELAYAAQRCLQTPSSFVNKLSTGCKSLHD